jgi:glycosyltransferase involved in cell wall biosynthesis
VDICIIICTYNRAAMLRDSLESFLRMERPVDSKVQVLVVDNNSNDETAAIGHEFCQRAPELFRYLSEPAQGLSFARNSGILASTAEVIAFVDDDVYFDKRWLVEILEAFRLTGAMCIGGRSIPNFEAGKPSWISTDLLVLYGSTNSGDAIKQMKFPEHPFGLNMAFRREVFASVGHFNTTLGRIKSSLLSNEEVDLFFRIDKASLPVFYTPFAIIHHRIPESRTLKSWVLKRYYFQGISDTAFKHIVNRVSLRNSLLGIAGKLVWVFKLLYWAMVARIRRSDDDGKKFGRLTMIYYVLGILVRSVAELPHLRRSGIAGHGAGK